MPIPLDLYHGGCQDLCPGGCQSRWMSIPLDTNHVGAARELLRQIADAGFFVLFSFLCFWLLAGAVRFDAVRCGRLVLFLYHGISFSYGA